MFAKLLKYEWRSNAPTFGILSAAALGVSILGGVLLRTLIHRGSALGGIAAFSLGTLLFFVMLSLIGYFIAVEIMLLVHFYKNKFTDEGYLTFTLPVNSHQIFLSSMVNMLLWSLISMLVLSVSVAIMLLITATGIDHTYIDQFTQGFPEFYETFYPDTYRIVDLLSRIISLVYGVVLPMTCLTVGAVIAKKHKILAAFGIYYGISVIMGTFESILTIAVSLDSMMESAQAGTELMLSTNIASMIVQLVVTVAGYFTSTYLMKRELNLS